MSLLEDRSPSISAESAYWPAAPTVRVPPTPVTADTHVIHQVQPALGAPLHVYINSLVITGAEPTIVDTGTIANRQQWLDDVFNLVDPLDVRWVFLSHDDIDHTGNLAHVMAACPHATLVTSWAISERHSNAFEFPLERVRWINDGESFDVGDRRLTAVRPPTWDSPTTRGLFDSRTGVYWAADAFATPMPAGPVATVAELDADFWRDGMTMFTHHALSPWLSLVDEARYAALCDSVQSLSITSIASAHSPLIEHNSIRRAFELMRGLPATPPPPAPDQVVLDEILRTMGF